MHKNIAINEKMINHTISLSESAFTNNAICIKQIRNEYWFDHGVGQSVSTLSRETISALALIKFTHALVSSTDFLIFCGFYCFRGLIKFTHASKLTSFASAPLIVLVGHLSSSVGHYLNDNMIMIFWIFWR